HQPPTASEGRRTMAGRARVTVAVLMVLSLALMACGNSGDDDTSTPTSDRGGGGGGPVSEAERDTFEPIEGVPGVTDDAITYAVIGVEANNPLGICILDCYRAGIQAYFDHRNAEGGIYGRELRI